MLVGAITKSAMVPFHFWLPAAMEAPTPVSAYLHAAAMVKAGSTWSPAGPGFADVPAWRPIVLGLGLATMLVGGYRALRQNDLKLLLAFGTVSQLGFLLVLVGAGSREMAVAGLTMLVAHALFKSTLFLSVGVIDHATGTRDLRALSGLGRRLPGLAVIAGVAGASMAGLPPMIGFVGKEAAFTALGGRPPGPHGRPPGAGRAGARVGAHGRVHPALPVGSLRPQARLRRHGGAAPSRRAVPGRAGGARLHQPGPRSRSARCWRRWSPGTPTSCPIAPEPEELALWHGLQPALVLSALSLAGGIALFAFRAPISRFQRRVAVGASADEGYWNTMQGLDRLAVLVTGTTQRGSLPAYLGTILVVVLALPGAVLLFRAPWPGEWRAWDTPIQALVGAVMLIAGDPGAADPAAALGGAASSASPATAWR